MGDLKFALLLAVRFVILIFNCSAGGSLVPLQDGTGEYQSCSAHQQPFDLILFRGNRQIPGLATGAVGHSLFYSRR